MSGETSPGKRRTGPLSDLDDENADKHRTYDGPSILACHEVLRVLLKRFLREEGGGNSEFRKCLHSVKEMRIRLRFLGEDRVPTFYLARSQSV